MSEYNMPPIGLFGRRCKIKTGFDKQPLVYRIISSGTVSNAWCEIPLSAQSKPTTHDYSKHILIVVLDTLISDDSRLIRVAANDVELMYESRAKYMLKQPLEESPLVLYLAMYAPAPEGAPKDWYNRGDENLAAWQKFIREAERRGYYAFPIDERKTEMLIDADALAEWLAKNYEPPYKLCKEEIGNLRWPIDYNQQKEIWLRRLAEFSQTIGTKKD